VRVQIDPRYFRPTEVDLLLGDASKAERKLGWRHEIDFDALVAEMVREDLKVVPSELRRHAD
jgi:GDPmannose 4,6-dehydratase